MFDFWIAAVLIWLVVSAIGYLFWRFLGWLFGLATRHNCEHCGRQLTRNWSCTACVTPKLVAASAPTPSLAPVPVPAPADRSLKSDLQSAQRLMEYGKHLGAWDDKRIAFIRDSLALLSPDVSVAKQPASKQPAAMQADAKQPVAKISDFGGARSPLELPPAKRVELQPVGAKDEPLQLQRTSAATERENQIPYCVCTKRMLPGILAGNAARSFFFDTRRIQPLASQETCPQSPKLESEWIRTEKIR